MVSRIALLVTGAHKRGEDISHGFSKDVAKVTDWLRSNEGGGWEMDEIHFPAPTRSDLGAYFQVAKKATYCFLAFFGHGEGDQDDPNDIVLGLERGETILASELHPGTERCTRLIDVCRRLEPVVEGVTKVAGAPQRIVEDYRRAQHRKRFDVELLASDPGVFTMFACSPGEFAYCSREGGEFTGNLIAAAHTWRMTGYSLDATLTVGEVFSETGRVMEGGMLPQIPAYDDTVDGRLFPFGVIVK